MASSPGPEISLGDLARVVGSVAGDPDQLRRAAALLGLAAPAGAGPGPATPTGITRGGPVAGTTPAGVTGAAAPGPTEGPDAGWGTRPLRSVRTVLEAAPARPAQEFLRGTDALPPPLEEADPPPPGPLFLPRWERALVAAAIAVDGPGGAIDVEEVVRRVARARPVTPLPTRQRPSLRQGAHVLLDTGKAMLAFFEDRRSLAAVLRRVVGTDRTTVARFVGTPSRGAGTGPSDEWAPFTPTPGRPVVLVSDLGVAPSPDRAGIEEWLAFTARMREAGCPVVAYSPYPAWRVAPPLAAAVTLVFWDDATGPGKVAREARRRR